MHRRIRGWMRSAAWAMVLVLALSMLPGWEASAASGGMARVKLTRLGSRESVTFTVSCDYYLADDPAVRVPAGERATVTASGSTVSLTVNGSSLFKGSALALMRSKPGSEGAQFTSPSLSNRYCGDLLFSASGSQLTTILNIYIEDYLYGVVGYEMSPSWNVEALKAQAVAARNYALQMMNSRADRAYHLVDNTSNQVFKGLSLSSGYANVIRAVDGTKGIVLYDGSRLAQCYYSASNGGQTESTRNAWGTALSYSVVRDDPYDYASSGVVREAVIRRDAQALAAPLAQALTEGAAGKLAAAGVDVRSVKINRIESIVPGSARFDAPSRLYRTLTFTVQATAVAMDGTQADGVLSVEIPTYGGLESWYGLSINSGSNETVWVEAGEDSFRISFRRFGHGVGMSQRGAQVMAGEYGMNAAEILQFYYPGTQARRLTLTDTTADRQPQIQYTPIGAAYAADGAAIYSEASLTAGKLVSLARGAQIDVYAVRGSWAAVGSGGRLGFMPVSQMQGYLPAGESVSAAPEQTLAEVTAAEGTALLELPAEGANRKTLLAPGARLQVIACTRSWAAVRAGDGAGGYVRLDALTLCSAEPSATPSPQPVVTPGELYAQVLPAEGAPLHRAADAQSEVLSTLPQGSYVCVRAYNSVWAFVQTPSGETGFAALSQLRPVSGGHAAATPSPEPEVAVPDSAMFARAAAYSPIHASPDDASSVIGSLNAGDIVRVRAYNRSWALVETPAGIAGFVPLQKLRVIAAGETATSSPTPAPTVAATPAPTATPDADGVIIPEGELTARAIRDTGVYRTNDASSPVRGSMRAGECAAVLAYNRSWALVQLASGVQGFVPLDRLQAVAAAPTVGPTASPVPTAAVQNPGEVTLVKGTKYMYVVGASAGLYADFSTESRRLDKLPYGTRVQIGAYNADWACVRVNGRTGFILRSALTQRSPVARSAQDVITAQFCAETTAVAPVYMGPGTGTQLLGSLPRGVRVTVYAYNNAFAYIGAGENRGFTALGNLKIVAE